MPEGCTELEGQLRTTTAQSAVARVSIPPSPSSCCCVDCSWDCCCSSSSPPPEKLPAASRPPESAGSEMIDDGIRYCAGALLYPPAERESYSSAKAKVKLHMHFLFLGSFLVCASYLSGCGCNCKTQKKKKKGCCARGFVVCPLCLFNPLPLLILLPCRSHSSNWHRSPHVYTTHHSTSGFSRQLPKLPRRSSTRHQRSRVLSSRSRTHMPHIELTAVELPIALWLEKDNQESM